MPLQPLTLITICCFSFAFSVDVRSRVDCSPDPHSLNEQKCKSRGCVWEFPQVDAPKETPPCYFPSTTGYVKTKDLGNGVLVLEKQNGPLNPFGADISPLKLKTHYIGSTFELSIGNDDRYIPPLNLPKEQPNDNSDPLDFQETSGTNGTFTFQMIRRSTGRIIWDTSIGGLLFADQYIQIATLLPSTNIFGFGEHVHKTLKHDMTRYTTWPMFATGFPPDSGSQLSTHPLYGVHPFYLCIEPDGKTHGVLLLNSNAQEVTLGPAPHLVYRTIGGQLDFVFFAGPTPEAAIQGYLSYIGKPFLPAYWALGYQLSRWGYQGVDEMKTVIRRNQAAGIPLDVAVADIDYMSTYEDFTEGEKWSTFPEYAQELHSQNVNLILIFDPAIENVSFVEWPRFDQVPTKIQDQYPLAKNTKMMLGNVWPERNVAFPDFLDPTNKTELWWIDEFRRFHDMLPYDGIWIDMNEPENFQTGTLKGNNSNGKTLQCIVDGIDGKFDNPPYETKAVYDGFDPFLASKTLCLNGLSIRGTNNLYNTKSLYGWSESRATAKAHQSAIKKRGAVISRSTFVSSGRYTGHWLGDNVARWEDLRTSVIGVIEFNFFGIPYVGSDICGFTGVTWEELCLRWHQMGAFHSFSRDHNMHYMPAQDPAVWPSVTKAAKIALTFRYRYLPYLYSLHYRASTIGSTVVRPLFFEFSSDSETFSIDRQFLWGKALMIAPALDPGIDSVHAYFPDDLWYSLQDETYGKIIPPGYNDVPAKNDTLTPVFARGGYILPRQTPSTTTKESRNNPFELLVTVGQNSISEGELYYDDGVTQFDSIDQNPHFSFNFTYSYSRTAASLNARWSTSISNYTLPTLDIIDIVGYDYTPDFNSFYLNGKRININIQTSSYSPFTRRLFISTKNLIDMNAESTTLAWSHKAV
ncbi:unnamed protein product, partial [Mesorhabditis belari]|uniref:P-type domain-containing protein n=1 Tax=Mesorhabditis belari TaxID=2138241 RepID=A0AAF3J9R8_9BILA